MTWRGKRVHFIGIGGIGMSGIAKMLHSQGAAVTGSDINSREKVEELRAFGIHVELGPHDAASIDPSIDIVVISAAIKPSNVELREARRFGIEVLTYAEMLGRLMSEMKGVAVSGTHGKTTTTAMTASILTAAGFDPSFVIGGEVRALGGTSKVGSGEIFVVEACEYKRSFHNLLPQVAVITNIEEDHLDYYRDLQEISESFREFASHVPEDGLIVANTQDRNVRAVVAKQKATVQTYGVRVEADWMGSEPVWDGKRTRFHASFRGEPIGEFELQVVGVHNVLDALAAMAACSWLGAPTEAVYDGLATFEGVGRRFEILGRCGGVTVVDDYAHHPTEIQVTLKAARDRFAGRRIWCVFQPHQHSRTRFLMKDFARSFGNADKIVIPDIYFVRDSEADRELVTSLDLVGEISNLGGDAVYFPSFGEIEQYLMKNMREGDVLITMGAGDVYKVAHAVLERINGHAKGSPGGSALKEKEASQ
ncbi:MAG: UDP-N-acetylmuramate--L-alanine ligase [Planctomycetes bacterium]|nr:UDP-N-acetylmuramate--L-alanine ligase [Planctomycetota bacterium]